MIKYQWVCVRNLFLIIAISVTAAAGADAKKAAKQWKKASNRTAERMLLKGESVQKMRASGNGSLLVLTEQLSSGMGMLTPQRRLIEISGDGQITVVHETNDSERIADFDRLDDGRVTVVVIPRMLKQYPIDLRIIGPTGAVAFVMAIAASAIPESPEKPRTPSTPWGLTQDLARVVATGNSFYLAARGPSNGLFLERYQPDGKTAFKRSWQRIIGCSNGVGAVGYTSGSYDNFHQTQVRFIPYLAADSNGDAYVATLATNAVVLGINAMFNENLKVPDLVPGQLDPSALIVTRVTIKGERKPAHLVWMGADAEIYGMAVAQAGLVVGGRIRKNDAQRDSQIFVARLGVPNLEPIFNKTMTTHLSGVLLAVALSQNGDLVGGGSDGWSQNPSGLSLGIFGNNLLIEFDKSGRLRRQVKVPDGPRHNQISALLSLADGRLCIGGMQNGPLTHTADHDPKALFADGFIVCTKQ